MWSAGLERPSDMRLTRRVFVGTLLAAVGGVATASHEWLERRGPDDQRISLGDLTLLVRAEPWQVSVLGPEGQVLWTEAPDEPLGFRRRSGEVVRARRLLSVSRLGDGAVLLIAGTDPPGATLALEARSVAPRRLRLLITPDARADTVEAVLGSILAPTDEHFVGLGERFTSVEQRGQTIDVWVQDRLLAGYQSSSYAPVPLLLSSRGYSFALERFERALFDLAASQPDRWSWEQRAPAASALVSYGPSLRELVRHTVEATGKPPLPPVWAFGVCKTAVGGQDEVLAEAERLRVLNVPVTSIFAYDAVDVEANIGWPTVNFAGRHAGPYPDPAAFTERLHHLGFKALNYLTADYHLEQPNYADPASHGFLVKQADGRPYVQARFKESWLDFSSREAVSWWGATWRRTLGELGYDGGMLDLGELIPVDARFADGSTGAEMHNRFPLLYQQAAWEQALRARPSGDFVLMARSGGRGAQRFQSLQWGGDAVMRWNGPDGLQSLVPAALSFGLSGFPYFHAEVAGYVQQESLESPDPRQERELWLRWLQLATWTCALRDHYGDHPRASIDPWLDDETLTAWRDAARIHNALVPYLYSCAAEATQTGLPVMRFRALEVQDERAWTDDTSYFLGSLFLVAPVLEPGATSRTVYLPRGQWVDYWSDTLYSGGQEVTVPAPLAGGRAPVFVRAGALVPLAADFDTLAPSTQPAVRTYTGDLVIRIMPGSGDASSFVLYDGTQLAWDGSALTISDNAQQRAIELRLPDGASLRHQLEGPLARLAVG